VGFSIFIDHTQAILIAQGQHQLGQRLVANTSAELPIERIGGRLAQRKAIISSSARSSSGESNIVIHSDASIHGRPRRKATALPQL